MQNLPQEGLIYISNTAHTAQAVKVYVERVGIIDADEFGPETFCVLCCDPDDKDNPDGKGYEFFGEEWHDHGFSPYTSGQ